MSRGPQDRASDWFGFTSIQDWSRNQHSLMLEERQIQKKTGRIIPQSNEEYGYEDHYPHWAPKPDGDSAEILRRCAWEIAMAGASLTHTNATVPSPNEIPPGSALAGFVIRSLTDTSKPLGCAFTTWDRPPITAGYGEPPVVTDPGLEEGEGREVTAIVNTPSFWEVLAARFERFPAWGLAPPHFSG